MYEVWPFGQSGGAETLGGLFALTVGAVEGAAGGATAGAEGPMVVGGDTVVVDGTVVVLRGTVVVVDGAVVVLRGVVVVVDGAVVVLRGTVVVVDGTLAALEGAVADPGDGAAAAGAPPSTATRAGVSRSSAANGTAYRRARAAPTLLTVGTRVKVISSELLVVFGKTADKVAPRSFGQKFVALEVTIS